jgi:cytochrome c oxidase assembly protein subunit 15
MTGISPTGYRRVTFVALVLLCVIVVTGAAVRLTGSGLGCPQWPNCEPGSLTPHGDSGPHAFVEFVNRAFTGLVSVAVIVAVLGSLVRRPRRRDLTWLSVGLVLGVVAQIVLGGLAVIFELSPGWVMAHFLVSMLLVADAVVLHHRAGHPDGAPVVPSTAPQVRTMARVLVGLAAAVLATGTVVTGAGPHGGDENVHRLDVAVADVARVHGVAMNLFLASVLLTMWFMRRTQASPAHWRAATTLLFVLTAQAGVGYVQYFSGVPTGLVAVHILGAVSVWVAVLHFLLRTSSPVDLPAPAPDLVQLTS